MKLLFAVLGFVLVGPDILCHANQAGVQKQASVARFYGKWTWVYYLKDKDLRNPDLVEIYKDLVVRNAGFHGLDLDLSQKGNRLTGECFSWMDFGDRIDGGDVRAIIQGNRAEFKLKSPHGGKVRVRLTRGQNRLYWRIVKAEGDYWFPEKAVLRRVQRRR